MIRHDGRGEGAIGGVTGPVPDHRVKKNSTANVTVHDRPPMGMVEMERRQDKLEAQIEALKAALQAVTADVTAPNVTAGVTRGRSAAERQRDSRARRRQATPLPANVTKLVPRSITGRRPSLGKPAMVIAFAEAVAARRAVA